MGIISRMLARSAAGRVLGELAEQALKHGADIAQWRNLLSRSAQAGDLDAIYEVYVRPVQKRAQKYIDSREE